MEDCKMTGIQVMRKLLVALLTNLCSQAQRRQVVLDHLPCADIVCICYKNIVIMSNV